MLVTEGLTARNMTGKSLLTWLPFLVFVGLCVAIAGYFGRGLYRGAMTISELLTENRELKQAITNLTSEDQIGYAKVVSQQTDEGRLLTTVRFVETARADRTKRILQKECTIDGDIVHFDAMIVRFEDKMVLDGKARALYLWRRIYGEKTAPENAYAIEDCGVEPQRYADLLRALPIKQRELFWAQIWDLANDPNKLSQYGIRAIYGNDVYCRLREGLIYVFKITPTGQFSVEDVLDM
jgi:hypothetical protein